MNKKKISPEPGLRIRHFREKQALTRAEFEEITGVSASTLRYIETGQRELSPIKARLLSNLFILLFKEHEATPDFLLYGDNKFNKEEEN